MDIKYILHKLLDKVAPLRLFGGFFSPDLWIEKLTPHSKNSDSDSLMIVLPAFNLARNFIIKHYDEKKAGIIQWRHTIKGVTT